MKYFFLMLSFATAVTTAQIHAATKPAVAAKPEQYRIEAKIMVGGKIISSPRITAPAGEKAIVKQSGRDGEDIVSMEASAQKEPSSGAGKLQIDLKFSGSKVGNSRQKIVAMPGETTSIKFYNHKGEMVEATIRARRL